MCVPPQSEYDHFQVLLLGRDGTEVLASTSENGFSLPSIEIPKNTRVAEECNAAVAKQLGITAYSLCTRRIPTGADKPSFVRCIVMETSRAETNAPARMSWIPLGSPLSASFESRDDIRLLTEWIAAPAKEISSTELFSRPRTLRTIFAWVETQTTSAGLHLTGDFRQLNCGPQYSLIRFRTKDSGVWFKAVGEPNLHEFPITLAITNLLPSFLPPLLGTRPDWNAWLTVEAEGTHPDENSTLAKWKTAATALSQLQIESFANALHLIGAECRDLRACRLQQEIATFLEVIAELMSQQTTPAPAPLSHEQLRTLGAQIEEALGILENTDIPNGLGHSDLSPGNLLVRQDSCIFLDWSEGFIGHPFLTIPYLIEYLRRDPAGHLWEPQILAAYAATWRNHFDEAKLSAAFSVAPLLAAFTYAISIVTSRKLAPPFDDRTAKLLRSLTRRMKREADAFTNGEHLCVS